MGSALHLASLSIEGFRGIRELALPQLGRVTLLAGVNGVGKTSVLDAVRFYASRGDGRVIVELIDTREEFTQAVDDDGDTTLFPDFASLFHNFDAAVHESTPVVRIRSKPATYNLSLELLDAPEDPDAAPTLLPESRPQNLGVRVGQRKQLVRAGPMAYYGPSRRYHGPARPSRRPNAWPPPIHFESLGPGLLRNQDVARLWDGVVLTEAEDIVLETPRLVVGKRLERLTVVGGPESGGSGRRVVAKLSARSAPVPLKRLGDGANRLLAIALALANCRGGILLMDEVENGIHYSVQSDLWRMIFRAAQSANVQVIAATHSWDCVVGFARAADESPADGWLYRLEREEDELAAVGYSETNLIVAARQRTEVR